MADRVVTVFDLDAAAAAKREALGEGLTFTWRGEEYTVPPPGAWDFEVQARLSGGYPVPAMTLILGEEQAARYWATRPSITDVTALMEAVSSQSGLTPGE